MREIKFRAWDTEYSRFMEIVSLEINFSYKMKKHIAIWRKPYKFENSNAISFRAKVNKTILMQYTGLKDKNGVEIYEGDILKSVDKKDNKANEWIGVVEDNNFGWLALKYTEYLNPSWLGALSTPINEPQNASWIMQSCEVIGNIYENKNLIDEVK